jgi:putative ABC transport system substrate-binding protein
VNVADRRRRWLCARVLGGLAGLCASGLDAQGRTPRVGLLANASPQPKMPAPIEALRDALRELGYVEGRTIEIEYRWAEGRAERLPELAVDLVRSQVDLIVASGDAPTRAAIVATRTIPIVMATSGDAVGAGFVRSLAWPGGNVTGMTAINPELGAKRLQLMRELRPGATRMAVLLNSDDASHALGLQAVQQAAHQSGLILLPIELRAVEDVDGALVRLSRAGCDALIAFNDTITTAVRPRIIQWAAAARVPAMYEAREWVVAGGLVAYGVTHVDLFRQSAHHIDRILKGAKPADLPVERPTRVRLTLNLTTARALGLAVPKSLLVRADEVIE